MGRASWAPRSAPATVASRDDATGKPAEGDYARLGLDNLKLPTGVETGQAGERLRLWQALEDGYLAQRPGGSAAAHRLVYERASRLMHSEAAAAFDLEQETEKVRDAYGRGRFGQGCLLARRLVERGVPFVEVTLGSIDGNSPGWDTHQNNFPAVRNLSGELDAAWSRARGRAAGSRAAGIDDHLVDGGVRPHADDQQQCGPRPFSRRLELPCWPAAASAAAWPTAARATTA